MEEKGKKELKRKINERGCPIKNVMTLYMYFSNLRYDP